MKLINFEFENQLKVGLKTENNIIDIEKTLQNIGTNYIPRTMKEIINNGLEFLKMIESEINAHKDQIAYVNKDAIKFHPCINKPGKIICVGLNYRKHAIESNMPIPKEPILFNKFNNSLAAHRENIIISKYSNELDYEAELGIVIGKSAKDVHKEGALNYVFGYFVANDLSARDLQFKSSQWLLGKSIDGYLPIGPYLVTKDEINNPNNLKITCKLNGEVRQDSNTSDMIFNCEEIISYTSKFITLEPGDIIITGTPEGVIMGDPEEIREWIKPNDEVTVSIEGLGTLTNCFVAEE